MHDIYRTDKIPADLGENCVIFIDPIGTFYPIKRSNKLMKLGKLFSGRVGPKQAITRGLRHLSRLTNRTKVWPRLCLTNNEHVFTSVVFFLSGRR